MLDTLRKNRSARLIQGFVAGLVFGVLLEKGGVGNYDVILGQLLLADYTVVKIMLSAVVTGMLGVHAMKSLGWVTLHPKSGSFGTSIVGGLIFGVAFAVGGFCPGTAAAAVGSGHIDALFGGLAGMVVGSALFAAAYPRLKKRILDVGYFGRIRLPELLRVNDWVIVVPVAIAIVGLLWWLETTGL